MPLDGLPALAPALPREVYCLDSARHGVVKDDARTKLCVAGAMSDHAAVVGRADFSEYALAIKDGGKFYCVTP